VIHKAERNPCFATAALHNQSGGIGERERIVANVGVSINPDPTNFLR